MTYQVLARKWRPRNFREMAGQGHVLKTLINSLDNDRLHHAYLFTGTRGVGKTTIARILARCLNCEKGVTSEPCGECSACREIDEGRFIDLIEVDAASRTKVEDTRELLDNVQYSPTRGRYKVYLIDEVHMLSGHSFNALLKTLEEPPPHVKFLLATTDPQKLPVTVLSRCLQFNLKNISPERLVEHIKYILDEEKIPFEEPALWQLGRAAQGSVRDCLTLLDQAIGYCDGNITDHDVRSFLGTIDQSVIHALVDALAAQDAAEMLGIIEAAAEHAPDFSAVLADLQSYLHRVAIAQAVPEGIDNAQGDREQVLAHAGQLSAETLQLYYQIALKGREDLPYAIDARAGLEMATLRMLAFTPAEMAAAPVAPTGVQDAGDVKKKSPLSEPALTDPQISPSSQPADSISPETRAATAATLAVRLKRESVKSPVKFDDAMPNTGFTRATETAAQVLPAAKEAKSLPEQSHQPASAPAAPKHDVADALVSQPAKALTDFKTDSWVSVFNQLPLEGITRSIAANCLLDSVTGNQVSLVLDESQTAVFNEEHLRRINTALNDYFRQEVRLAITPGTIAAETPAAWRDRMDQERLQQAHETFANDATVKAILERFSGAIDPDSIEPTTPKHY